MLMVIVIIMVIMMTGWYRDPDDHSDRDNRGDRDDHAFSLHFRSDVNRGAAACSWVNSLHHQLENWERIYYVDRQEWSKFSFGSNTNILTLFLIQTDTHSSSDTVARFKSMWICKAMTFLTMSMTSLIWYLHRQPKKTDWWWSRLLLKVIHLCIYIRMALSWHHFSYCTAVLTQRQHSKVNLQGLPNLWQPWHLFRQPRHLWGQPWHLGLQPRQAVWYFWYLNANPSHVTDCLVDNGKLVITTPRKSAVTSSSSSSPSPWNPDENHAFFPVFNFQSTTLICSSLPVVGGGPIWQNSTF